MYNETDTNKAIYILLGHYKYTCIGRLIRYIFNAFLASYNKHFAQVGSKGNLEVLIVRRCVLIFFSKK